MDRFDIVLLKETKNLQYISGPKGKITKPEGYWTVISSNSDKVLLSKEETIIQVPIEDVFLVAKYDISKVFKAIKQVRTLEDVEKLGGSSEEGRKGRSERSS